MDEATEVVETAILITQYEQKAKAEIVKLQFHLGQAQTELQAHKDAAAKDTHEINALRLEGTHLKEKCTEAQQRYEMLTILLPSLSSSAQKARDDADTLIREIEIRKSTYNQESMELHGMSERKLKLRDVICDRIKRRVSQILKERDDLLAERDELASKFRLMQQRQQAIVQCEQRIAQLQESHMQTKKKLEQALENQKANVAQVEHNQQREEHHASMLSSSVSALSTSSSASSSSIPLWTQNESSSHFKANDSSSLCSIGFEEPRIRLMKRELSIICTELDDIKMLIRIYSSLKANLENSGIQRVAENGPEIFASTKALCVECTYQSLASQNDFNEDINETSNYALHQDQTLSSSSVTAALDDLSFSTDKLSTSIDEDSGLFSPRASNQGLLSTSNTPACTPHLSNSVSIPGYSLQSISEDSHLDPPSESVQTPHHVQSDNNASVASGKCHQSNMDVDIGDKRLANDMRGSLASDQGDSGSVCDPNKRVRILADGE